jgi:uncharacterized protein (TIGR00269 family)
MVKCDKCSRDAIIHLSYGPHNYCKTHFNEQFEKRFKKTIRQFGLIKNTDYIGVATSGGKDSMVLLYLINKIFKPRRLKFCAIFIDEGIQNYSNKTYNIVKKFCEKNNIKLIKSSHKKEFGISTEEVAKKHNKKEGSICTYCGVMRRQTINKLANNENVTKIATGHNLDDECQTIIMNLMDNDLTRFFRTGPSAGIIEMEETKPRIKPFYLTPEREIAAYALYNNIPFYEYTCPFFKGGKRTKFRILINNIENNYPGSKFSLIKSFLKIKDNKKDEILKIIKTKQIKKCKICGKETSGDICKSCELLKNI